MQSSLPSLSFCFHLLCLDSSFSYGHRSSLNLASCVNTETLWVLLYIGERSREGLCREELCAYPASDPSCCGVQLWCSRDTPQTTWLFFFASPFTSYSGAGRTHGAGGRGVLSLRTQPSGPRSSCHPCVWLGWGRRVGTAIAARGTAWAAHNLHVLPALHAHQRSMCSPWSYRSASQIARFFSLCRPSRLVWVCVDPSNL